MAIMRLTNVGTVGVTGVTVAGISEPTSASAEKSYGTVQRAKGSDGDVKAALVGKQSYSLSVSGYSTDAEGPELGSDISVGGLSGKVTSTNVEKSVEDFSKFTAEGRGIPAADAPDQ